MDSARKSWRIISMSMAAALPLLGTSCMTHTQWADNIQGIRNTAAYGKEYRYTKLLTNGKYTEAAQECLERLEEARKDGMRAREILWAGRAADVYFNNLKEHSKAIELAEAALVLVEAGEKEGPLNEPDSHFFHVLGLDGRKTLGDEYADKMKTNHYRDSKAQLHGLLSRAYNAVGDTGKSAYYTRLFQAETKTAGDAMKEQMELQALANKKTQEYYAKRYGRHIAENAAAQGDDRPQHRQPQEKEVGELVRPHQRAVEDITRDNPGKEDADLRHHKRRANRFGQNTDGTVGH
jgi:hypothetical protein